MNHLVLVAVILAFCTPGISAQNYNPKFDEGPNLAEFVKVATEDPALQSVSPYPPVVFETVKTLSLQEEILPSLRKEFLRPGAGYFYGPYPPRIYNSGPYQNGQPYFSLLQAHESPMAQKLLVQWDAINTIRGELLNNANTLDPKDTAMYAEAKQLDQNAAIINQERDKVNAEVAQWNQQCAGHTPTPQCTSWSNTLDKKLADIKKRIAEHNAKVDNWKIRKKGFDGEVRAFIDKVLSWEAGIDNFISDAKEALASHGTCTEEEWQPLYDAVKEACDVKRACDKDQNCETLFKNLAQNRACHKARVKIKEECYADSTDPGHDIAINEALSAINKCLGLIQELQCPEPQPGTSVPQRHYGYVGY